MSPRKPRKLCPICLEKHTKRPSGVYCSKKCFGLSEKGKPKSNRGRKLGHYMTPEHIKNLRLSHLGHKHTEEQKNKIADSNRGQRRSLEFCINLGNRSRGEKCHFWKGGIYALNYNERASFENRPEYHFFRNRIFHRDNYMCRLCGDKKRKGHKVKIEMHHIKPFSIFKELRMVESNVITVCHSCHIKTDNYGGKIFSKKENANA